MATSQGETPAIFLLLSFGAVVVAVAGAVVAGALPKAAEAVAVAVRLWLWAQLWL